MRMRQVGWVKRSETGATTSGLPLHSQKSSLLGFVTSTQPTTIVISTYIEKFPTRYSKKKLDLTRLIFIWNNYIFLKKKGRQQPHDLTY